MIHKSLKSKLEAMDTEAKHCDCCNKQVSRLLFCNDKCRVKFHRHDTKANTKANSTNNNDTKANIEAREGKEDKNFTPVVQKTTSTRLNNYVTNRINLDDWKPNPRLSKEYATAKGHKR